MRLLLIFLFYIVYMQSNYAQLWHLPDGKKNANIPFELINNMIIVSVKLNSETLSFIVDNGVKETLLFGEVDSLRLKNTSAFIFQGFGIGQPIKGLMSRQNKLEVGGIVDTSHNLYVITDTVFNLSKNIGVHIHGILGSTFFRNNVLAIDYVKKKITFTKDVADLRLNVSKYKTIPITIENDRAYAYTSIKARNQIFENKKLLIDLGNSDAMMLFESKLEQFIINKPFIRDYLGYGFNGAVYGLKNRIEELTFGQYNIKLPIVSYPDTLSYDGNKIAKDRVGSVGNQILSRFYLIFDYPNNILYLRSNKNYRKPFTIDMSGLEIVHEGFEFVKHRITKFNRKDEHGGTTVNFSTEVNYLIELHANYVIDQIRPNSPADRVGVRAGDKVLRINGRKVGKTKLQDIKQKFQSGQNKLVRIEISRANQIKVFEFRLEDPLAIDSAN